MYGNYRELLYVGLILGVEFFFGNLFKECTDLFIESTFMSRNVAYLLNVIAVCVIIYVGTKKGIISKIRIDFDEVTFSNLLKWSLLCLFCMILSLLFTVFLLSFSDSAWVVGGNVSSNNAELLFSEKVIYLIVSAIGAPVVEELVCRGVLIGVLRKHCDIRVAILVISLIFGVLHFTSISVIFNASIMGLAFSYMYVKTDNLVFSMYMHGIMNCVVVLKSYGGLL